MQNSSRKAEDGLQVREQKKQKKKMKGGAQIFRAAAKKRPLAPDKVKKRGSTALFDPPQKKTPILKGTKEPKCPEVEKAFEHAKRRGHQKVKVIIRIKKKEDPL